MIRQFCLLALMAIFSRVTGLAKENIRPMNLLVIQTDEHNFRTLGCYREHLLGRQAYMWGEKAVVETPNIDSIAHRGALCTSFYATSPVCTPSRAALYTGLYPQNAGAFSNDIPLNDNAVTFAERLRRLGYATGYAGKWHLDGPGKPQWEPQRSFGFDDNRFMFNRGHWKKFIDTPKGPAVGSRNKKGPNYSLNGADEKTFSTDWLCDKAVDFIDEHADEPWCYMVNLPDPHGPNTVRPPYDTMYEDVEVPIPVTLKRDPQQIPAWGKPANVKPAQLKRLMRNYYGMVKCIDDNVGKLLNTLREKGELNDTIIVFTSDHGDLCGEHGRLNKGVPYEGSARIPFLIYCDGKIKPDTVVDEALSNVDFLPTVMRLLNVKFDHTVDGRDASPLFTADGFEWDDFAIIRSTGQPGRVGNAWISVITAQYKLVYSTNEDPWLIDLKSDPNELRNLFADPQHKPLIKRLSQHLVAYGEEHDDPYVTYPRIRPWLAQVTR